MHQKALTQKLGMKNSVALIVTTLDGMLGNPLHQAVPKRALWVSPPQRINPRAYQYKEPIHSVTLRIQQL